MVRQAGTPNEDNESRFGGYPRGGGRTIISSQQRNVIKTQNTRNEPRQLLSHGGVRPVACPTHPHRAP
jgi:hypothetical protein